MDSKEIVELQFKNGDKYKGTYFDNTIEGEGEYFFSNGNRYKGSFKNNQFNGKGVFFDSVNNQAIEAKFENNNPLNPVRILSQNDGSEYFGDIIEGYRSGRGVYRFPNDDKRCKVYEGEFSLNLMQGHGKLEYKDGTIYEGQFRENLPWGVGKITHPDYEYEGEIDEGRKQGKGKMRFNNGDFYEGEFRGDMRHGYGVMKYHDGSIYQGNYDSDKKFGKGEMIFKEEKYVGYFKDGYFDGEGVYYGKDYKFTGTFKGNEATGDGIIEFNDGSKFEGKFMRNKKMGQARMTIINKGKQHVYQGSFSHNIENPDEASFGPRF